MYGPVRTGAQTGVKIGSLWICQQLFVLVVSLYFVSQVNAYVGPFEEEKSNYEDIGLQARFVPLCRHVCRFIFEYIYGTSFFLPNEDDWTE